MRICLVSQEYPPETGGGGIGTQTSLKAKGLSARGHEVHVVAGSRDHESRMYQEGPVTIHRIGQPWLHVPGYEESTYLMAYSQTVAEKLHELMSDAPFQLIQFPEYGGEGFFYQTDTFANRTARYVVQLHGPLAMFSECVAWPKPGSTFHQIGCFMERTVIHHADLVLASSHYTAAFCAARYEYPLEKIRVIHSAVDTALFAPCPRAEDAGGPRVLFVGNLVESKGLYPVVRAVAALRRTYPAIALRAIGKGSEEELSDLQRLIRQEGVSAKVQIVGYVPHHQLPEHYAWCDFFAGPSLFEGGPGNVYLEAMACGRPVIAGNTGGVPEVVQPGETGLLVSPGGIDELKDAIVLLTEDAPFRERLGRNGREWILQRFSVEKYIDRVELLYEEALRAESVSEER